MTTSHLLLGSLLALAACGGRQAYPTQTAVVSEGPSNGNDAAQSTGPAPGTTSPSTTQSAPTTPPPAPTTPVAPPPPTPPR